MRWKSDSEKDIDVVKIIVLDYLYTHKNFPKKITHKNIKFKVAYYEFNDELKCVVYNEVDEYKEKNMMTRLSFFISWKDIATVNPKLRNKNDRSYYRIYNHKKLIMKTHNA